MGGSVCVYGRTCKNFGHSTKSNENLLGEMVVTSTNLSLL